MEDLAEKEMLVMDLDLGIIGGDEKRALECYVDPRFFRQRKNYDEYYVDIDVVEFNHGIKDMMILASHFLVVVNSNSISLKYL